MNARTPTESEAMDAISSLRVPPHSIEAESSVLGGLLLDNTAWDRVGDLLNEGDFYRHEHRLIFGAIAALVNANKPADVITVAEHMQRAGKTEEIGGMAYLNDLAQFIPSAGNIRRYAEIVRERAILRKLVAVSDEIATMAFNPEGRTVQSIVDDAEQKIANISQHEKRGEAETMDTVIVRVIDHISNLADGKLQPGIKTGIPTLDRLLGGGAKPGKVIVIGARPAVGKTAVATAIAKAFAKAGHPAGILSQEMEADELTQRMLADEGYINLDSIQTGKLFDNEWTSLTEATDLIARLPLYIDDQPGLTLHDIRNKARAMKRKYGIKLLALDYVQLCASGSTGEKSNRHHQIEEISRGIKNLAKQLELTFIVLSQLGREVEKRTSGKPMLSDLKESGSLEEDADTVLLLSVDHVRPNGTKVIHAEMPKNRGGKTGFFKLAFTGEYQRIVETVEDHTMQFPKKPPSKHYTSEV